MNCFIVDIVSLLEITHNHYFLLTVGLPYQAQQASIFIAGNIF